MTIQQLDFDTYLKNLSTYKPNPAFIKPIIKSNPSKPSLPSTPLPPILIDNSKIVNQLRKSADGLTSQIDKKFNPAIANQRLTARRARIADGMAQEARMLQTVQSKLYALADAHENGTIPPLLSKIRHRSEIEEILWHIKYPNKWYGENTKLDKIDITPGNFADVEAAFNNLGDTIKDDPLKTKIKQLERSLLGVKIPGFFPTPKNICQQMVAMARIEPKDTILEPSAGNGNIAEVIREQYPDNLLSVIEWQNQLNDILTLKGFEVIGYDFLQCTKTFDRIIMNPPFEKFQDIDHVYHAYNLLNSDGILVSIMSESVFFSSTSKAKDFREWLFLNGYDEKLPANSFKDSGTGVQARIVVISK